MLAKKCGELPIKHFLVLKIDTTATQTHHTINTLRETHFFRAQIIQQEDYSRTLQQRFHENSPATRFKPMTFRLMSSCQALPSLQGFAYLQLLTLPLLVHYGNLELSLKPLIWPL